jgi:hypothetical protein
VQGGDRDWLRFIDDEELAEQPPTLFRWNSSAEPQGGPPSMEEPLASDRPDFTEASCTVGRGVVQIETGYTYFFDNDGATQLVSHSYPEMLLRVGVFADWLELRAAWNYGVEQQSRHDLRQSSSGAEDLYLGAKIGLTQQQGWWPEMALMPQATMPIGAGTFTGEQFLPGLNWLYGWDINEFLCFGGSTQGNLTTDPVSGQEFLEMAQSLTIGYTLTDKLGAYTEWFVIAPAGADTATTEHYLDGGFTFRVTNNLQLDVRGGKGLSQNSLDYFTGAGAVVRF